ncbi:cell division protein FtsA [Candidatus Giovannonibacteria bacterium RIFCSPHIGHO2_02_43_13]|uniref:Cell division protein FtsA n=1 Tax=Candidatus Giovannonibacteria bacterium RIFCSPHIGHO2_02_43_13 TaxID=1798330 RepID=A0A1F5WS39_9BACT|nr:MAG: Cell division protein ftsA [Parcubacteria group bacterium GW2011_GWA2_44_13]OGF73295.1 MAG: cell division protein FtsA [Candidatus Giovannonibacteria bacterium RIFCSPHIGHO2_12_FULL_44_42]OGF78483.1 MAG: cell division protein FtsA [Candidatus Giovannonibacteria bacterium RIFCSPHIGHO2_02_43_13]OGF97454.1 MAG: cell division protein FtsA [Candidatus Giovannonibacteria bacterium RIFCSPLOWO2_12_FULL_44_32]
MKSRAVIGIDLGTDSVKAVALEMGGDGNIKVLGAATNVLDGIRKGVIIDSEAAAKSLKTAMENLENATGISDCAAYVGIGGIGLAFQKSKGLVAISRADGQISKEDVKRAVATSETNLSRAQNREILHQIPISYKIDNETLTHDPVGLSGIKLEAETLFISIFSQNFKSLLKTLDEADIDVEDIIALPFTLSSSVLTKREIEFGVMILDIGAATTSLMLFEENHPYSLEVLPIGSSHITNDIAVGFQITLEEAEKLKLNYGTVESETLHGVPKKSSRDELVYGHYSKKKLSIIIDARLGDIFELIEKHLKKVGRMGLLPAGIVITGGGSNLPGIAEYAKDHLKLPARVAEPANLGGFQDKIKNNIWSGAIGVALMALEEKKRQSSLLRGPSGPFFRWLRAFLP